MTVPDSVVTIFACGTLSHRDLKWKYAVPHLHEHCGGRKFILDGPGGAPILKAEAIYKNLGKGKATPDSMFNAKRGGGSKGLRNMFGTAWNGITGGGTQDNILLALNWLKLEFFKTRFHTINLIGWSRGGITCLKLAHAIQRSDLGRLAGNLKVNIFTYDPVAGGVNDFAVKGDFESTGRAGDLEQLPPCVKAYRSIVQENIQMFMGPIPKDMNFVCTVPKPSSECASYEIIPMPGGHADACTIDGTRESNPIGFIGKHLALEFLSRHGTRLDVDLRQLLPFDLCELYADVRQKSVKKSTPSTHRKKVVQNTKRQHHFYINDHHERMVLTYSRPMWSYLRLAQSDPAQISADLRQRMTQWMQFHAGSKTVAALEKLGIRPDDLAAAPEIGQGDMLRAA